MLRTTKGVVLLSLAGLLFTYVDICTKLGDHPKTKPIVKIQNVSFANYAVTIAKLIFLQNTSSSDLEKEESMVRPKVNCPPHQSGLQCGEVLPVPISNIEDFLAQGGSYEELCEGDFSISAIEFDTNLDYCSESFSLIRRKYTLTDACGYSKSCIQRFVYDQDNEAPQADCSVITDMYVDCEDYNIEDQVQEWLQDSKTALLAASSDNCVAMTGSHNYLDNVQDELGCDPESGLTVTYYIYDACGQRASCQATIKVRPARPSVGQPHDKAGFVCGEKLPVPATTIEEYIALGGEIEEHCGKGLSLSHEDIGDVESVNYCSDRPIVIRRRYTVTDGCGNSKSTIQRFEFLKDTEPPVIDCGSMNDFVVDCDKSLLEGDIQEWIATMQNKIMQSATDNCSTMSVSNNYAAGSAAKMDCTGKDVMRISFNVSDACSNTSSCHASITSNLSQAGRPDVICVTDIDNILCGEQLPKAMSTIEDFTNAGGEIINYCDGEISIRAEDIGSINTVNICSARTNILRRRYIINDNCGNERRCIQRLIFQQDIEAPSVDCDLTNDLIINCNTDASEQDISDWINSVADDLEVASSDNCSGLSISHNYIPNSAVSLNCSDNKELVVTYLISDDCGNTNSCSVSIFKEDTGSSGLILGNRIAKLKTIQLFQNVPNPFEESTSIKFELKKADKVRLTVYDMNGKLLYEQSKEHDEGLNTILITRESLNNVSGIVFYSLEADGFKEVKTMVLLE